LLLGLVTMAFSRSIWLFGAVADLPDRIERGAGRPQRRVARSGAAGTAWAHVVLSGPDHGLCHGVGHVHHPVHLHSAPPCSSCPGCSI
jgi:hypothetical protein